MSSRENIGRGTKRVNVRARRGGALVLFCILAILVASQGWRQARETRQERDKTRDTTTPELSWLESDAWFRHPLQDPERGDRLTQVQGLEVSLGDYLDYLLARVGSAFAEDMVMDLLLERETRRRGLAEGAMREARREAETEAAKAPPPRGLGRDDWLVRLANRALHRIRTRALVLADRKVTDAELRALFDEHYGVDGHRVEIRQIFLSHAVTRRQLGDAKDTDVASATERRALGILEKLKKGSSFESLLTESDDPATRSLLSHPRYKARAGIVEGYNYQRYGSAFAAAVRKLSVSEVSRPVKTSHGCHIIQLLARKSTRFADVRRELIELFQDAPVSVLEERRLREKLFRDHGIRIPR